ncbi:MAG TPA: dihydropteroate synthase [Dehalococcoidia bacterium]
MVNVRPLALRDSADLQRELARLGYPATAQPEVAASTLPRVLRVDGLSLHDATAAAGQAEAAGVRAVLPPTVDAPAAAAVPLLLSGPLDGLRRLADRLARAGGPLAGAAAAIRDAVAERERVLLCGGHRLPLGGRTYVMGIINLTDDSFAGGGFLGDPAAAVEHGKRLLAEGADILDVGGESARADVPVVPDQEEIRRVVPVIRRLAEETGAPISVDTYKPAVAEAAVAAGAAIINDIGSPKLGGEMAAVAARTGAALVINHTWERPKVRPALPPVYDDLLGHVYGYLAEQAAAAVAAGVPRERLMVDPGVAFGKSHDEDLEVIRRLPELRGLGLAILVAASRKHFIGSVLGTPVDQRLEGTAAVVSIAIAGGADIVRVHDVRELARVARMTDALVRARPGDFAPGPGTWPAPAS